MDGVTLTAEEQEEVGGALVTFAYAVPWSDVAGRVALALAPAMLLLAGALLGPRRAGSLPWEEGMSFELLQEQHLLAVYGVLISMALSTAVLHVWRRLNGGPGLVAGSRGLRVHGAWPWPCVHPWREVASVSVDRRSLVVRLVPAAWPRSQITRALRLLLGAPLRVPARDHDPAAVRAELERLRDAAMAAPP